jgi:hypothetical protein
LKFDTLYDDDVHNCDVNYNIDVGADDHANDEYKMMIMMLMQIHISMMPRITQINDAYDNG